MTTNVPVVDAPSTVPAAPRENYLNCSSGFWSWAGTLDHKRIGLMYLVGVTLTFLAGGLFVEAAGPTAARAADPGIRTRAHRRPTPSHQVYGYLPYWQLDAGTARRLDYRQLSTIAFFAVPIGVDGALQRHVVADDRSGLGLGLVLFLLRVAGLTGEHGGGDGHDRHPTHGPPTSGSPRHDSFSSVVSPRPVAGGSRSAGG